MLRVADAPGGIKEVKTTVTPLTGLDNPSVTLPSRGCANGVRTTVLYGVPPVIRRLLTRLARMVKLLLVADVSPLATASS